MRSDNFGHDAPWHGALWQVVELLAPKSVELLRARSDADDADLAVAAQTSGCFTASLVSAAIRSTISFGVPAGAKIAVQNGIA
jgi:hypothetical protein